MAKRFNPLTGKVETYAIPPRGETGPAGPMGPQGEKGEKGDTGPQGVAGAEGPRGMRGPKGDKGEKGDTGPAGANGKDAVNKNVVHRTHVGYPPELLGMDGDWAFNEAAEIFFKRSGKWEFYSQIGNLKQGGSTTVVNNNSAAEYTGPEFTYDGQGVLTRIDYDDGSYKVFTYSAGKLSQIDFIIFGGDTIRKTFNYTGDVLTSIDQQTI